MGQVLKRRGRLFKWMSTDMAQRRSIARGRASSSRASGANSNHSWGAGWWLPALILSAGLACGYIVGVLWPGPGEAMGLITPAETPAPARVRAEKPRQSPELAEIEQQNAELRLKLQKAQEELAESKIRNVLSQTPKR